MDSPNRQLIVISTGTMVRAVAVIAVVFFMIAVREVIGILLVSILLAALLDPIADFFERRKIPRTVSVLVTFIIIFVLFGVLLVSIIPPMIEQTRQIVENFGALWERLVSSFEALRSVSARYGLLDNFQTSLKSIDTAISGAFVGLFSTITNVIGGIFSFFIIMVISFFLVVEKQSIRSVFNTLLPRRYHMYVNGLLIKMQTKVGQWLLGQIILMIFVGLLTYIGLRLMNVQYALLLAVIAGLTEIIPYAGPVIGAVPAIFFASAQSPTLGLLTLLLYFVIQRIENNILVPKIMQKTTGLNPVLAILALAVGYQLGGVGGVILAIPVATAGNVILTDYIERQNHKPA